MNLAIRLFKHKRILDKSFFLRHDYSKCAFCYKELTYPQVFTCSFNCQQQIDLRSCASLLRKEVLKRDKFFCQACGVNLSSVYKALRIIAKALPKELDDVLRRLWIPRDRIGRAPADADHILPVSLGGGAGVEGDILDNLQTLCLICHSEKGREDHLNASNYRSNRINS
jgi:5-methylcytosine-specific restriction endonuclease McrA